MPERIPHSPSFRRIRQRERNHLPYPRQRTRQFPWKIIFGLAIAAVFIYVVAINISGKVSTSPGPITQDPDVLFQDPLTSDNHAAGWPDGSSCNFESDGYHFAQDTGTCTLSSGNFGDATVSVTARWIDGPKAATYGLVFRGYCYIIRGDGRWKAYRCYYDSSEVRFRRSSAINRGEGAINVLKMKIKGARVTLSVNGKVVAKNRHVHLEDEGGVALYAYNGTYEGHNEVVYTDLVVKRLK